MLNRTEGITSGCPARAGGDGVDQVRERLEVVTMEMRGPEVWQW